MGLVLHLVAKDLRRKVRSPLGLLAALSFPILFAGMIAIAFGRGSSVPKVRMLVANEDDGLLASAVASAFTSQQAATAFDGRVVTAAEGLALMNGGKASALLTIPKGFTQDVLDGKPVTLRLLRNPSEGILPEIAEQTSGALVDVLDAGRRVFDRPIADLRPLLSASGSPANAEVVAISLAFKLTLDATGDLVFPPAIVLQSELFGNATPAARAAGEKEGESPSVVFLFVLPGVAVYGLFLVADQGMRDVMTERTQGTLRRQLAGPVRPETIILGKAVFTAVLAAGATVVLALVGAVVLTRAVSLPAFLLLSAALVLAVTGTAAVIYGLARTERLASTLANMIFLMMGFLGGGFISIEALPGVVQRIAPLTPLYWGTQGFKALLQNGAGVGGVLKPVIVLTLMGAAFLAVGAFALRRSAVRGISG